MDQQRFNQEMGAYLSNQRKKQDQLGSVEMAVDKEEASKAARKKELKSGATIVEYESGSSWWDRILSWIVGEPVEHEHEPEQPKEELTSREKKKLKKMTKKREDEYVEMENMDDDLDVPQPSFFEKLLSFLGAGDHVYEDEFEEFNPDEYATEEAEQVMWEEDVKEVMKIAHRWIDELPAKKKKAFKQSGDFERYKGLLDKLGLLKK